MGVDEAWHTLRDVPDPEIPVISVVDLGIVRDIRENEGVLEVDLTPTYSGCPATQVIEDAVREALTEKGFERFEITTVLSPPWSTEMISEEAKEKLRDYGIAPPAQESIDKQALMGEPRMIVCPNCQSNNTKMVSQFGSTPCKAHFKCIDCLEPFDYFKCL